MKLRTLISYMPELFLIVSVIYYWTLTASLFNPYAIGLLGILVYQIINKKFTLGVIISALVIVLSIFLFFALISELSEFEFINQNYKNLLIFGSLYIGLNLILGFVMLMKYIKLKFK